MTTSTYGQETDCRDFRTGSFYIPPSDDLPISYRVVRTTTEQIETIIGSPKGVVKENNQKPQYGLLQWIDDCSYRIWFDASRGTLSDTQILINDNNGVLIELLDREADCFSFKSTFIKGDQTISFIGRQCKEN
ncbi:MAG: hypothetical protein ABJM06_06410 [Gilvibacter sp.]